MYSAGNSAWGTALAGVQFLLVGDVENYMNSFCSAADNSVGGTGMGIKQSTSYVGTIWGI